MASIKRRKFYQVEMLFEPQRGANLPAVERVVLEHWLRYFYGSQLNGRDLANSIGAVSIEIRVLANPTVAARRNPNWWEDAWAVRRIYDPDRELAS